MKYGFLGPHGTFAEEALLKTQKVDSKDIIPYTNVQDVIQAVQSGEVSKGIVPIENSIEGSRTGSLNEKNVRSEP